MEDANNCSREARSILGRHADPLIKARNTRVLSDELKFDLKSGWNELRLSRLKMGVVSPQVGFITLK